MNTSAFDHDQNYPRPELSSAMNKPRLSHFACKRDYGSFQETICSLIIICGIAMFHMNSIPEGAMHDMNIFVRKQKKWNNFVGYCESFEARLSCKHV